MEQFWIRFSRKLTKIVKISSVPGVCMKRIMLCNCLCSCSCFSASAIWNIREFRAKSYFTDHQRTNTIHSFRDSFVDLKIYNLLGHANIWATFHFDPSNNKARTVCWCKQCTSNNFQILQTVCNYSNCMIDQLLYYWETF